MVSLEDAKTYLRVDTADEDTLITGMIEQAHQLVLDVSRSDESTVNESSIARTAEFYTIGYLFEHREDADMHGLVLTLRSILFSLREGVV